MAPTTSPGRSPALPTEQHPYFACGATPCPRNRLVAPSAACYVHPKDSPMQLIHGEANMSTPPAQIRIFSRC